MRTLWSVAIWPPVQARVGALAALLTALRLELLTPMGFPPAHHSLCTTMGSVRRNARRADREPFQPGLAAAQLVHAQLLVERGLADLQLGGEVGARQLGVEVQRLLQPLPLLLSQQGR